MLSEMTLVPLEGTDAAETAAKPIELAEGIKRVVVILIKPTHYDKDGFPYRFWRGVLPSNSLAAMYSLTNEALANLPRDVPAEVHVLEDGIARHAKQLERLYERFPEEATKLIVGLVAVQTGQFPRACDLIDRWRLKGATCVIGGFHVSGSISTMLDGIEDRNRPDIPCPHRMPEEIQALMDKGVIVFHGEAEQVWPEALADILRERHRLLYRGGQPFLNEAPLPTYPPEYWTKSFATIMGTFDTGRGCPFTCSFCTIINVQGRKSRYREPQAIIDRIKSICEHEGQAKFFFTDDNFARNPQWRAILDGLADLRRQGCKITFMIEADVACYKIEGFIPKLAEAGCTQIFMGVESMNPANLVGTGKRQNKVDQYRHMFELCHEHGIAIHAGYIVGFPHDTPESVPQDVDRLIEAGVDQAALFVLTPLPGSEDHARLVAAGVKMDSDFNKFDSFNPVVDHPRMSREDWAATYRAAWHRFYRVGNMIAALKRCLNAEHRRHLLCNLIWYRWSFATEHTHPMIAGLYRMRPFGDRRPGAARLPYWRYLLQEGWRHVRYFGRFLAEFYRFQHVVFETEFAPILATKRSELTVRIRGIGDWLRLTFGPLMTRQWLNEFWLRYGRQRWRLLINPLAYHWHLRMLPLAFTEIVYTMRFACMLPRLVTNERIASNRRFA